MLIVDSQVHIWEQAGSGGHHRQVASFTKEDLLREMDQAGVDAAILCPRAAGPESGNEVALAAAREYPHRFAVMGWFPLDDVSKRSKVTQCKQTPGLCGLRWAMNQPGQNAWWSDGTMEWLWPAAEQAGVPLAFIVGDNMKAFGDIAERHPKLRLIIDHLGRSGRKTNADAFRDLDNMLELSKYENVAVKLSGAPSYSSDPYPFRNIHPYIQKIIEAFGPARSFWGTDMTRLSCSYRECVTMFTEEMPWLGGRDLELVMGRALCDWLGWAPDRTGARQ